MISTTILDNGVAIAVWPIGNDMHQMRLIDLQGHAETAVSRDLTEYEVHMLLGFYHTVGTPYMNAEINEFWETIFPQEDWRYLGQ